MFILLPESTGMRETDSGAGKQRGRSRAVHQAEDARTFIAAGLAGVRGVAHLQGIRVAPRGLEDRGEGLVAPQVA